jgi:hypothetical protein
VAIKKLRHIAHPDKPLRFDWILPWRPKSLEQLDDVIRLTARSRDMRIVRAYVLGQAIRVAREGPEQWISYSRREEWYSNAERGRYWPVRRMYSSVTSAIDQLAAADLIQNRVVPPGHLKFQSTFRATPKLMALIEENHVSLILGNRELIILRDGDKHPKPYDDTREVIRMRRDLEEYNEAVSSMRVCINGQRIIEGELVDFGKDKNGEDRRVGAATLTAVRIFNGDFRRGGRHYGPAIQGAPKEQRKSITIDGGATDEPDYPSLHPQLVYALIGAPLPEDPYDLCGWDRDIVKPAFNVMLNAQSPNAAMLKIAEDLGGYTGGHRELAKRLMAEIERKHAQIADYFYTGIGLRLQRTDSEMMQRVLAAGRKEGERLLPIHDSCTSRHQYAGRVREHMDEIYEKVVGKPPTRKCSFSAHYVLDRAGQNLVALPQSAPWVVGWVPGSLPLPASLVVSLPPGLASLAVVASFYSGSVVGLERVA